MKQQFLVVAWFAMTAMLSAQVSFRGAGPVETDSQGHVIEKLDYDRKIVATNGLPTAAE